MGFGVDTIAFDPSQIMRQPCDAVRIPAAEVCFGQGIGYGLRIGGFESNGDENLETKRIELMVINEPSLIRDLGQLHSPEVGKGPARKPNQFASKNILYIIQRMSTKSHSIEPLTRKEGLRDNVARHLLSAIFSGAIKSGDRLVAQTLAKQMGVSATPVREALVELASIGLIENLPNRGAVCMPFGVRELREMYHLRRILEIEATRLACGRMPIEHLRDLRIGLAKLAERKVSDWSDQAMELDEQLHSIIANHCDNTRLQHEIDRYRDLMQAIRVVVGDKQRVQFRAVEQHIEIIDALIEGNASKASHAMGNHIDTTAVGVERILFPQNG